MLFAAVHESPVGTFRTSRDVRLESAFGGKAEVGFRGRQVCFGPRAELDPVSAPSQLQPIFRWPRRYAFPFRRRIVHAEGHMEGRKHITLFGGVCRALRGTQACGAGPAAVLTNILSIKRMPGAKAAGGRTA